VPAPAGPADDDVTLGSSLGPTLAGRPDADRPDADRPDADRPDADIEPPAAVTGVGVDRERTRDLFARLSALSEGDPQRQRVRDSLVEQHLPLVEHLARRFRNRGEPYDDLVQVATIGLIKSVDRFDLGRGVEFSTYATPTIVGEIKRHFRDKGWAVRVPRRLQELRLSTHAATSELSQRNGRSPTVAELAATSSSSRRRSSRGSSRPTPTRRSRSTPVSPTTTTRSPWWTPSGSTTRGSRAWSIASR
jgi:RNA polymerase sigma-B factor